MRPLTLEGIRRTGCIPLLTPVVRLRSGSISIPNAHGCYVTAVEFPAKLVQPFLRLLEAVAANCHTPTLPMTEIHGRHLFWFECRAAKPDVVDAQSKPVPRNVQVRTGSAVRLAGNVCGATERVLLTFDAVQIVRLAPSAVCDFTPVEGGYVFDAQA